MRIIRGKYKSRHIPTPTNFTARPTTDFAKEGLFNILENVYIDFDAEPTALDLFAGTGSISLELASRGCRKVVSVEKSYKHWLYLSRLQKELQAKEWLPLKGDVFRYASACKEKYDIIFADPPYALENLKDIPETVLPLLADESISSIRASIIDISAFSSLILLFDNFSFLTISFVSTSLIFNNFNSSFNLEITL